MDFDLSDEQRLLQDSAARYVQERCSFEQWQQWRRDGRQPGLELWPAMAQMGWLSLPFAAADGGLDGGAVETMLLMQALGTGLVAEPYLQTVVMGGEVLKRSPAGMARSSRLTALQEGRCRIALACDEAAARYDRSVVQTTAQPVGLKALSITLAKAAASKALTWQTGREGSTGSRPDRVKTCQMPSLFSQ